MDKLAAVVVIQRGEKVLAVARRGTTDQWGLPGGKLDPGETPQEAAQRECLEETGLLVELGNRVLVSWVDDYQVSFFIGEIPGDAEPTQGDSGPVKWASWDELLGGPFSENMHLLRSSLI